MQKPLHEVIQQFLIDTPENGSPLSQAEFARRVGVAHSTINRIIKERVRPLGLTDRVVRNYIKKRSKKVLTSP